MFSCFCANKRNSQKKTSQFGEPYKIPTLLIQGHKGKENQVVVDASSTMDTPQIFKNKNLKDLQPSSQFQLLKQATQDEMKIKKISSIKEIDNQNFEDSAEQSSSQKDSETIPYKSKKQASEISTPKHIRKIFPQKNSKKFHSISNQIQHHSQNNEKNHCQISEKEDQFKAQFVFSKTPEQDIIKRYFSIDKQINNFHSKREIDPQKDGNIKESIGFASVDYSRYSQIDKQVSSNQILDLDEQMQNKLQQIQNNSNRNDQKTVLNHQSNQLLLFQADKTTNRFKLKTNKFQSIQNDFDELEKTQNQIHINLFQNSNILFKNKISQNSRRSMKQELNIVQNKHQPSQQKQKAQQYNGQLQQNPVQSQNNLIQSTIKSQLDCIIDQNIYFCTKQSLKQPQTLQNFRKFTQQDDTSLMDETLEEAQNAFNCFSINQEFSRALITQNFDLSYKIFQRMTAEQKNMTDPKGYTPVHLAVLKVIINQQCFQLAKKLMFHPDVKLNVQGPTGWSPLQEIISYKHIRLSPNIFVASHRKKLALIRNTLSESSKILSQMKDFYLQLDVKVDSFIPLLSSITPQDTIKITKIGSSLMIDYTLVGYEYLSCKRRDMGFLLNEQSIFALNRSKQIYCDLLQQLDKQEIQLLVVESLQCETKKIEPQVNKIEMKQARSIFDNQIIDVINNYKAKKFTFAVDYTSKTQKRMPQKFQSKKSSFNSNQSRLLQHLSSWEKYLKYEPEINIKPKNKNKKIQLQMWLSQQFQFQISNILKIFQLFSLCNPVAKIISSFLNQNYSSFDQLQNQFPIKIDIPINFSLYFNLEFKELKFDHFQKSNLQIESNLQKSSRKAFQNIAQSKEKRSFAISAFT